MNEWSTAKSFEDLCELMAQFVEGDLGSCPGYLADSLDAESKPLIPVLAKLNRAGFMTICSQPGMKEVGFAQRAFVTGYARPELAQAIERLTVFTDLLVFAYGDLEVGGPRIPVTVDDFAQFTWCGMNCRDDLSHFGELCTSESMNDLLTTIELTVIDPSWARREYLWEQLAIACLYH